MIRLKSLQQRFSIFMLLPVAVLLIGMGFAGFTYARRQLLAQWGEATVLKLQRAAHHVDMRLSRPKEMLKLFNNTAGKPHAMHVQGMILDQLKQLEWVTRVDLQWLTNPDDPASHQDMYHHVYQREHLEGTGVREEIMMQPFHRGDIVDITPPHFGSPIGGETVSLISNLKDKAGQSVGRLEVDIRFDFLVDTVEQTGWWQEHKVFLVDNEGGILTSNLNETRTKLAEHDDPLERSTLYAMRSLPFGTVFGKGFPPREISGFYKLHEAPWTLVMVVPGKDILSPIVRFRLYYFVGGAVFIGIILCLIRFVTGRTVSAIKEVSDAARKVADGNLTISLPVKSEDEVGELFHSFNTMLVQLEERTQLKYSLNLAKEVQQNLLPSRSMQFDHLDIAGQSIYCDETGGDYYDFFGFSELGPGRVGVAVGDVSGHGVSAALFMTTVRALIRSRATQPGDISQMISDVNRLLCTDTAETGNFMTLFFALIDVSRKEIRWVRAGHDPAVLYDTVKDQFVYLDGRGVALGVDGNWVFEAYARSDWHYGQLVLIGTDGIWEAENEQGERFGKARLREILRRNSHLSAGKILKTITETLEDFRQKATQEDDVTLVVVKAAA